MALAGSQVCHSQFSVHTSRASRTPTCSSMQAGSCSVPAPAQLKSGFCGSTQRLQARQQQRTATRSQLTVRAAGQQITVDIDKPTGLSLGESKSKGGGLVVKNASGNAAKAGIKSGDTIIYTSSFFGDELWPADQLGFARTAMSAAPSPVSVVYVKGENNDINVKRLPKKAAPQRFGRKLTASQRELASHICVDCGYIYAQKTDFNELPNTYVCPQCNAPKKRFAEYDAQTGKVKGKGPAQAAQAATVVGGLVGVGILLYLGLTL